MKHFSVEEIAVFAKRVDLAEECREPVTPVTR
jgi:hypothetical protein